MIKDGKYIYCIIATDYDKYFGPIGIGGRKDLVSTISYKDLSMVVSDHPLSKFVINPENILAHQKVIEKVMKEFNSVLPVRFGTIAVTPDEIRNLLDNRYREFSELLEYFENKVEINIKGSWKDIGLIFKEIRKENITSISKLFKSSSTTKTLSKFSLRKLFIRKTVEKINKLHDIKGEKEKLIDVGRMVAKVLAEKKEAESEKIIDAFRKIVFEIKQNKTNGDATFMNTAILINSGREKEFDYIMEDLGKRYKNRIDFSYTTPLPAFNFINIKIFPEEWET